MEGLHTSFWHQKGVLNHTLALDTFLVIFGVIMEPLGVVIPILSDPFLILGGEGG